MLGWLASKPPGSNCFHLPRAATISIYHQAWIFKNRFWVSNSGPYAYKVNIFYQLNNLPSQNVNSLIHQLFISISKVSDSGFKGKNGSGLLFE